MPLARSGAAPRRRPGSRWALLAVLVVFCLGVAVHGFARSPNGIFARNPNEIVAATATGSHRLTVEWAVTEAQRERGLMERRSLPPDHGMLFDFGVAQMVDFWMKDTPLSLDMVFIDKDGTVYRIEKGTKPYSLDVIPSGAPVRYVLEVVAGESDRIGLAPGDRIAIPER